MIYFVINVSHVKRYIMVSNNRNTVIIERLFAQNMLKYLYLYHIVISCEYSVYRDIEYT